MANSSRSAGAAPPEKLDKALLQLAGAIMFGALAVQLDATMVNVAFNTLLRDFHTTLSTIQWVGTAYLLAMATIIPVTGWSIERFGAKTMWLVAVSVFLLGSILCGVAWSAPSLIAFRVVQGLGGGLILPLAQTILAQAAGPERLGRVMAAIGVPAILGPVLGPVLGGLITSDLSWRWIFYVNVPVCLTGLWYAWRVMPANTRAARTAAQRLDVLGLALLSPGIAALVYGLSEAGAKASFDNAQVWGPLAGGVVLLIGFVAHALTTRTEPLMDLRLFRARGYSTSVAVIFLSGLALFGATTLLPLYYQQVRLYSPLHAGVLMIPQGVGLGIALVIAGDLADKVNPRPITVVGLLLAAAGTVIYTQLTPTSNLILLGAGLFIGGAGLGAALVPVLTAALRGMRGSQIARATSSVRIFQQLGASFGIAVLVVILQREYTSHATAAKGHVTALVAAHSYGATFWWPFAFALAACVPALFLPPRQPGTGTEGGVENASAQSTAPVI